MNPGFQIIERELVTELKRKLDKAGLFYRIFSRIKENSSIQEKIIRKGDYSEKKKMQDVIGVRIITYFYEDILLIYNHLKVSEHFDNEVIDNHASDVFKPKRTNLVFRLKKDLAEIFDQSLHGFDNINTLFLDKTYEVQLRTIFSEGWHEIDHNLRYKCKTNWSDLNEEERLFNGIYATLETSDHVLQKMFDDIAYSHYRSSHIENMIRTKFRLRFGTEPINENISSILSKESLIKLIFKIDRNLVINNLLNQVSSFPLNINTLIFYINFHWLKDKRIKSITPSILIEDFQQSEIML
jgi:putative GTP pyrophosphokinase